MAKKINYSERFKKIKRYVDFHYTEKFLKSKRLNRKQKRKITVYFNAISALKSRPHYEYTPKSKDKRKIAQRFAQHTKNLPLLKTAFIPTWTGEHLKIKISKSGQMTVSSKHITFSDVVLNKKKLAKNAVEHVTEKIAESDAKGFTINAGQYEIPRGFTREKIAEAVQAYVSRYNEVGKNNYFGNWLTGLRGHKYRKQASFAKYLKEKSKAKQQLKKGVKHGKGKNKMRPEKN